MQRAAAWTALGLVLVVSVWLWPTPGSSDVAIWTRWLSNALRLGPIDGYVLNAHDYPPGSTLLLWASGRAGARLGLDPHAILKTLVSTFLTATTLVVLIWTRRPIMAAIAHASLAIGAIGLMYLDVLAVPFLVGAAWALARGRRRAALGLLLTACCVKWQPVMVVPFAAVYAWLTRPSQSSGARELGWLAAGVLGTGAALVGVFGRPVVESFYHATQHHHLSGQAANVGWILTWVLHVVAPATYGPIANGRVEVIVPAGWALVSIEKIAGVLAYGAVLARYARSRDRTAAGLVRHALVAYLAYFALSAGVHENHLQMALAFALALAALDRAWLWVALVIGVCANANMIAFYGLDGPLRVHVWLGVDATVWLAAVTVMAVAVVAVTLLQRRAAG